MAYPIKGARHKHHPHHLQKALKAEGAGPAPMPQHPGLDDVPDADQQSAIPANQTMMPAGGSTPDMGGGGDEGMPVG